MELSKRLETIVSLVTEGNRAADVGCDHGYVPIELVSRGISPSAIAADVREGPLSRAKDHILAAGLDGRIEARLSDGLKAIRPGEADRLIMSGIGGPLMVRLLREERETAHSFRELILSPQSDLEQARRFLHEDGYTVRSEYYCMEDGKYYVIMQVVPAADPEKWSKEEYLYGKRIAPETETAAAAYLDYIEKKQGRLLMSLQAQLEPGDPRIAAVKEQQRLTRQRQSQLHETRKENPEDTCKCAEMAD